jgi:Holliday junction resolvase RusA-like endonuclease
MIIPSQAYKDYEKECFLHIPKIDTIDYPINLKCVFYMPTRRRVDLVNLQEALCDILVKYGVLKDDNRNIVATMDGSMVLYDKENPRTEVEIKKIENYQVW